MYLFFYFKFILLKKKKKNIFIFFFIKKKKKKKKTSLIYLFINIYYRISSNELRLAGEKKKKNLHRYVEPIFKLFIIIY